VSIFSSIVTTINNPTKQILKLNQIVNNNKGTQIIVCDKKTPVDFYLQDAVVLNVELQKKLAYNLIKKTPYNHYSRKNIGYIYSIKEGFKLLYETDDDNEPTDNWLIPSSSHSEYIEASSDDINLNIYSIYTNELVWPRGLPLSSIHSKVNTKHITSSSKIFSIQQGLANGSPDVDAIWRLLYDKEVYFNELTLPVCVKNSNYVPFNSQNTWWFEAAFALLYLPSYCSFRMTDIWRSFVSQACLSASNMNILYKNADVYQDRNIHDLSNDFALEVSGYLSNKDIINDLSSSSLISNSNSIEDNLFNSYKILCDKKYIEDDELFLIDLWLKDVGVS